MATFSVKGIDATIGDWRWDGFADANPTGPLADKRTVLLSGGPIWERDEPVDEAWFAAVLPASHVARRAIEGAQLARRRAESAMYVATTRPGAFRDLEPRRTVTDLREDPRDPECRVQLHALRIRFDFADGRWLELHGDSLRRQHLHGGGNVTANQLAAATFAHRIAWREASAALLDAAARIGAHVPTTEQALDEVASYVAV